MPGERVPRLSLDEAQRRAADADVPGYMADLSVFQVLLRRPVLAKALNDLLSALLFEGTIDARRRELVIMRIGWVTGSEYEWTQHWRVAVGLGVAPEELLAVRSWEEARCFDPVDQAVLRATDEVVASGAISDATWRQLADAFTDDELVELVAVIANWSLFSTVLRSLEVPLEEGVVAWPPDGRRPLDPP